MMGLILTLVVTYCSTGCPIEETELFEKRRLAAMGDSKQALELFEYHGYRNEMDDSFFWLRVAAEQGDCSGMIEYAKMLSSVMLDSDGKNSWVKLAGERGCDTSGIEFVPSPPILDRE